MGSFTEVQASEIEKSLQALWEKQPNRDRVKTTLFNLVAYVNEPHRAERLERVLEPVTERFPCRVIALFEDRVSTAPYFKVEVAVDFIGDPTRLISSDRIHIRFSSHHRDRATFTVVPHLLPDLPLYLAWAALPTRQDPLFNMVEPYVSKVIFDPPPLEYISLFSKGVLDVLGHIPGGASDLRWAASRGWRGVIASAFATPDRFFCLQDLRSLSVFYADGLDDLGRDSRIPALYLQAWLASNLNWAYLGLTSQPNLTSIAYLIGGQTTEVQLTETPTTETFPPGTVVSVMGETREGYHFELKRSPQSQYVTMEGSSKEICEIPTTLYLPELPRYQLFAKELFQNETTDAYVQTLRLLTYFQAVL